ncbi:hypothetical protein POV27_18440 [Aureisphaera galaxeae]|uniref:hypothetical protein n=1 Tax=Aureisphaera galaxeae TaxID=1538023 RepID=UPI00234FB78B|nr:hypothetical protein [Aureisphaera galaxeae]MDC8006037.1 hypothetical protein [Aureisphaera galaxeae]
MSTERFIYLTVFTLAFLIGIFSYKYHKALKILLGVMGLGLFVEYLVEINKYWGLATEPYLYNIYIPLEYFLYASFFYVLNTGRRYLRKGILISVPVFLLVILLSLEIPLLNDKLITFVYTVSGILICTWSIWTLFVIKPLEGRKFVAHPLIWICGGLIIFYSGITPFNIAYNILLVRPESLELLSTIIQKGFNIFLYTSIGIGFVCSHRMKIS